MSSTDSSGKSSRYGLPVTGFTEAGPVEPKQLPSEFTHITNQRSVSMARPGPIIFSHQPGVVSAAAEAACAEGLRPVNSRMALLRSLLSVPQHSYASCARTSEPPFHIANGVGSGANRSADPVAAALRTAVMVSGLRVAALVDALGKRRGQIALARIGQHGEH